MPSFCETLKNDVHQELFEHAQVGWRPCQDELSYQLSLVLTS